MRKQATQTKWGRKVCHVGFDGDRNLRIVIHLKACDREENHYLFKKVIGDICLQMCKRAIAEAGRKMNPGVPSVTVLENTDRTMPSTLREQNMESVASANKLTRTTLSSKTYARKVTLK